MDAQVIEKLRAAGFDVTLKKWFASVAIRTDEAYGKGIALDSDEVPVSQHGKIQIVRLKSIPKLFAGSRRPPSFARGPTDEYMPFFLQIELAAVEYSDVTKRVEYDEEMERVYRQLRRRPDGTDANPIFSYVQAAFRLYMSLFDVSRDEFEAVAQRLSQSARHFMTGPSSTNYIQSLRDHLQR